MSTRAPSPTTERPIDKVLRGLHGVKSVSGRLMACCPVHDDREASLSIKETDDGKVLLKCHAGCDTQRIVAALGLEMRDLFPASQTRPHDRASQRRIVDEYLYCDEDRTILYRAVRTEPKGFYQQRPGAKGGGWINSVGEDVRRVLYRLPDLLAAPLEATVYIVEGEKDVKNLRTAGLVATTNVGGAGKWRAEYNEPLRDRHIVILPDNDQAGRLHAAQVATALSGIAASVRIVALPDLAEKGDVSDWVTSGGTVAALEQLSADTPPFALPDADNPTAHSNGATAALIGDLIGRDGLPWINAADGDLARVTDAAWAAVMQKNDVEPDLFTLHRQPVRLAHDGKAKLDIQPLTAERLREEVARDATWFAPRKDQETGEDTQVKAKPPRDVVINMLQVATIPLLWLARVVSVPVFAPDGRLVTKPGYDQPSGIFYDPAPGLDIPAIADGPTAEEVAAARDLLLKDYLADFPFVSDADRAHALAAILHPFVRSMIAGVTPLHGIEATGPGSGKGLLAAAVVRPFAGSSIGIITQPDTEDEWRKHITAMVLEAQTVVQIDNVTRPLDSGTLAGALTAPEWSDRQLGTNTQIKGEINWLWLMTANNPTFSTEMIRRTLRIRIAPTVDRPWERAAAEFTHPELLAWADEQRGALVAAALTLVRAWVAAGMRPGTETMGSYEQWARVIGGVLAVAGVPGLLANRDEQYELADNEGAKWRALVAAWWEAHGTDAVGVSDLFTLATETDGFDFGKGSDRAQQISFGRQLGKQRGRVYGKFAIALASKKQRLNQWRLVPPQGALSLETETVAPTADRGTAASKEDNGEATDIATCTDWLHSSEEALTVAQRQAARRLIGDSPANFRARLAAACGMAEPVAGLPGVAQPNDLHDPDDLTLANMFLHNGWETPDADEEAAIRRLLNLTEDEPLPADMKRRVAALVEGQG